MPNFTNYRYFARYLAKRYSANDACNSWLSFFKSLLYIIKCLFQVFICTVQLSWKLICINVIYIICFCQNVMYFSFEIRLTLRIHYIVSIVIIGFVWFEEEHDGNHRNHEHHRGKDTGTSQATVRKWSTTAFFTRSCKIVTISRLKWPFRLKTSGSIARYVRHNIVEPVDGTVRKLSRISE